MSRASSDVGLMFIAYNLRRIGNILTREVLKEYLRILFSSILAICDLSELIPMSFGKLVPVDDKLSVTNKCCLIRA
jgi:hypothetical protein